MACLGGSGAESDCREKNQAGGEYPDVSYLVHVLSPDMDVKMVWGGLVLS
ncbi:MAG: hypothetical protein IID30_05990 [Planctomycetes bacterium]|nr:hypothetical protein [Planctomycetota bacterium]